MYLTSFNAPTHCNGWQIMHSIAFQGPGHVLGNNTPKWTDSFNSSVNFITQFYWAQKNTNITTHHRYLELKTPIVPPCQCNIDHTTWGFIVVVFYVWMSSYFSNFAPLSKINWLYLCSNISGLSVLFYWSICLIFRQNNRLFLFLQLCRKTWN